MITNSSQANRRLPLRPVQEQMSENNRLCPGIPASRLDSSPHRVDLARPHPISRLREAPINNNLQYGLVSPAQHFGVDRVLRAARLPMLIFFTTQAFGPHQARSASTSGGCARAISGCGSSKIGQQRCLLG